LSENNASTVSPIMYCHSSAIAIVTEWNRITKSCKSLAHIKELVDDYAEDSFLKTYHETSKHAQIIMSELKILEQLINKLSL